MRDLREAAQRVVDNATPATESAANYFVWKHQLDHLRDALAAPPPSPSYDALLLIAQSVSGALERAGVAECDDPGEAIDVLRKRWEASSESGDLMHAILETPRAAYLAERLATPQPPKPAHTYGLAEVQGCTTETAPKPADTMINGLTEAETAATASVMGLAKPAGAVPDNRAEWSLHDRVEFALRDAGFDYDEAFDIASMAAREAAARDAGRADAVPALDIVLRERGLPTVADALGYSRNFSAANPALSQTTRDHIEGLCNMLEIAAQHPAPAPQQMTTQGEAAQVPRDSVPEGFAIVPRELTAENGAKAEFMGETFGGDAVSWTAIKAVHRAVVKWAEDARHG